MKCNCQNGGKHDNYRCDKETLEEFEERVIKAVINDIGVKIYWNHPEDMNS